MRIFDGSFLGPLVGLKSGLNFYMLLRSGPRVGLKRFTGAFYGNNQKNQPKNQ